MSELDNELKRIRIIIDEKMDDLLPEEVAGRIGENRLARAIRYSALSSGKRLRPFFVIKSADLFGVSEVCSSQVAAAIEFVHCFSLIHDDLPALDNDDFRRGKPSLHKEFDEATAILAGDALMSFAFEILSHESTHHDSFVRNELVSSFAKSIGINGLIGGQMIDMISEDTELTLEQVTRLQRMKTGQLFQLACDAGAILGKAPKNLRNALRGYANNIGLVFQITDDLLDVMEDSKSDNGKRQNKSDKKATYVSMLGVDKSRQQARILTEQAIEYLKPFGKSADIMRDLAKKIVDRTN